MVSAGASSSLIRLLALSLNRFLTSAIPPLYLSQLIKGRRHAAQTLTGAKDAMLFRIQQLNQQQQNNNPGVRLWEDRS